MRTLAYVRPTLASSAVVSDFASTLRAEQLRHLDAVRRACAILDGHAGRLPALASAHGTLTRQWFDAQRSLLGRCAQLDAEAESADQLDLRAVGLAEDIAQAQRQLTEILDSWWELENRCLRESVAVVEAQNAVTLELPIVEAVVPAALPADVFALLDSADSSSLSSLLDALVASLDATELDATLPDAAEPDAVSPDAVSPDAVSPDAVELDAADPDAADPDAADLDEAAPTGLEILFDPAPRDLEILFGPAPRDPVQSRRSIRFRRRQRSDRSSTDGSPSRVRSVVRTVLIPMAAIAAVIAALVALIVWIR
jgi:hypothetical protein